MINIRPDGWFFCRRAGAGWTLEDVLICAGVVQLRVSTRHRVRVGAHPWVPDFSILRPKSSTLANADIHSTKYCCGDVHRSFRGQKVGRANDIRPDVEFQEVTPELQCSQPARTTA